LRAADARAAQAQGARDLAKTNLYPSVNAVVQADHNEGQSTFASKNQWFVGVTLSWNVWDWGANWHDMKAAGAQAEGARLVAQRARDRVQLEVRSAVRGARAAFQKLDAAGRGATAAEEAYRIQSVRYNEGALTTTDLLVAQVDVTRARGALALARFEYLSAIVALHRAMGRAPELGLATALEVSP
jgi:outer membrane protein TolC